jgi:uncharacterized RDD family membrane protein YckC
MAQQLSASLPRRLAALLYDMFLLTALLMLATLLALLLNQGQSFGRYPPFFTGYLWLVSGAFLSWCWCHGGQTLGMLAWKIRLEQQNGQPILPYQALIRYGYATLGFWLGGISYWWCVIDADGQSLADRLAKTRMVSYPLR